GPVRVAGVSARTEWRSRAAYIARFKSIALGRGEVHLNLHVWHVNLDLRVHINGTVDLREGPLHLLGLASQNVQIGAEDADYDIIAGSYQHLIDSLVEVGLHIVVEPRIAVDHLLDGSQRLVVVD